jgi:hypothetical protein
MLVHGCFAQIVHVRSERVPYAIPLVVGREQYCQVVVLVVLAAYKSIKRRRRRNNIIIFPDLLM